MNDSLVGDLARALRAAQPSGEEATAAFCVGFLFERAGRDRLLAELTSERFA